MVYNNTGLLKRFGLLGIIFLTSSFFLSLATVTPVAAETLNAKVDFTRGDLEELDNGEHLVIIGNGIAQRSVVFGKERGAYTNSLINTNTNTEYVSKTHAEFRVILSDELSGGTEIRELNSDNMTAISFDWLAQTRLRQEFQVTFRGEFEGKTVKLHLHYEAIANQNFIRKWFTVDPFDAPGWAIEQAVTEDWEVVPDVQPLTVAPRYETLFPNGKTDYNKYNNLIIENSDVRFVPAEQSSEVAQHGNGKEGFYFFSDSLFGEELFDRTAGLRLSNKDFVEPTEGFISGKSIIGLWQGAPEIGFKRYRDYIADFYAVGKGKKDPVWFSTWYPYESGISEGLVMDTIDDMKKLGFYDMLHVDAGWQAGAPLEVNPDRFPNGLDPIAARLRANNMTLGLWMNPFSGSYENLEGYQEFRHQHPDWVDINTEHIICPLSGAGDYFRTRVLDIARSYPLDEIYWDGADWNIADCQSYDHSWRTYHEEHIKMIKFYAGILDEIHRLRPQFRVVIWSAPADIHWLKFADQLQFADVDDPPILESELIRRRQAYHLSFTMPYFANWGDWYGLGYRRQWADGIGYNFDAVKFALVSTIGNGGTQAGGSINLKVTPPHVSNFLKDLFTWRKRFANYFNVYQQVLNFPDGQNVDGEAHIINGQGFIMLYNQSNTAKTVDLPLSEPGLELNPASGYLLSDWTNLTSSTLIGLVHSKDKLSVVIPPLSYKIIGINI